MSRKYQGIPVDEPSIPVFFNRVDEDESDKREKNKTKNFGGCLIRLYDVYCIA